MSELLEKGLEPGFDLLDRAGSATITEGIEQCVRTNGDGNKSRQRLLHSLHEIVANLLRQLLAFKERFDRFLLNARQAGA